jgi:hypothetical protein
LELLCGNVRPFDGDGSFHQKDKTDQGEARRIGGIL